MVNSNDRDGQTKTPTHRNIIRKTHKNNNLLKTKTMLKPKYKLSGRPVFTFSMPGANSPLCPRQLRHWLWCIVFTYSKMSLRNCNKIRVGGVA